MPLNRLQQIIAERKAAREQTDPSTEEGEESTGATRTRGEARKEAKEERHDGIINAALQTIILKFFNGK